jgi:hypothetical protein
LIPGLSVGRFRLTDAERLGTTPVDSIYRFSDGSPALVSAFRYDLPSDARKRGEAVAWTQRQGALFKEAQSIFLARREIDAFRVAFDTSQFVAVPADSVFEHSIAIAVRRRGVAYMEVQYVYLVCDGFLKLRGTFASEAWPRSEFPAFAREVMRIARRSAVPSRANGACY